MLLLMYVDAIRIYMLTTGTKIFVYFFLRWSCASHSFDKLKWMTMKSCYRTRAHLLPYEISVPTLIFPLLMDAVTCLVRHDEG